MILSAEETLLERGYPGGAGPQGALLAEGQGAPRRGRRRPRGRDRRRRGERGPVAVAAACRPECRSSIAKSPDRRARHRRSFASTDRDASQARWNPFDRVATWPRAQGRRLRAARTLGALQVAAPARSPARRSRRVDEALVVVSGRAAEAASGRRRAGRLASAAATGRRTRPDAYARPLPRCPRGRSRCRDRERHRAHEHEHHAAEQPAPDSSHPRSRRCRTRRSSSRATGTAPARRGTRGSTTRAAERHSRPDTISAGREEAAEDRQRGGREDRVRGHSTAMTYGPPDAQKPPSPCTGAASRARAA